MEILVAIIIIALVAAVAYVVLARRPVRSRRFEEPGAAPVDLDRRGVPRGDPMAAAVADHARATHPADVVVAEERLQAQARQVAAGLHRGVGPGQPAATTAIPAAALANDPSLDKDFDPVTGERVDGFEDRANDPRYNDPRYDGRLAADWVDPREDERLR